MTTESQLKEIFSKATNEQRQRLSDIIYGAYVVCGENNGNISSNPTSDSTVPTDRETMKG